MKILIDMNLTPEWVKAFREEGIESVHWSEIGPLNATDKTIMKYAGENGYLVFTHDLDFGNILAATEAKGPSVIQVRTENSAPESLQDLLLRALKRFEEQIESGSLITILPGRMKVRILPLKRSGK